MAEFLLKIEQRDWQKKPDPFKKIIVTALTFKRTKS